MKEEVSDLSQIPAISGIDHDFYFRCLNERLLKSHQTYPQNRMVMGKNELLLSRLYNAA